MDATGTGTPQRNTNGKEEAAAKERERESERLFKRLDAKGKGYLTEEELTFKPLVRSTSPPRRYPKRNGSLATSNPESLNADRYGRELVAICDQTKDGRVTFDEFHSYLLKKDEELLLLFKKIAKDEKVIHIKKLRSSLKEAGLSMSDKDLNAFVERLDSKNDGVIDYNEWRDFLFLHPEPVTSLSQVFSFFNSVADVDINADSQAIPTEMMISTQGFLGQLKYLLAGGFAGAVSRTITAPLDRLKVLLQTSTQTHRSFSQIVSIKKGILQIYRDGGFLSFFKGNGLNVLKIIPESALKFFVFEHAKSYLALRSGVEKDNLGISSRLMAGGLAGLVSQFVIYPIETIKTRIMSQISNTKAIDMSKLAAEKLARDNSIPYTIRNLYREDGIRAFYRGCGPALIGIVPYAGIDLAIFETLKNTWMKLHPKDESIPIPVVLCCGMLSGTCGAVLMYPLSLVRTRLQAQGTPSHPTLYSSAFDVISKTYAREGIVGFYRGLAPTLLKVIPAASISYLVYERSKSSLNLK